jgi:hypothetical protein
VPAIAIWIAIGARPRQKPRYQCVAHVRRFIQEYATRINKSGMERYPARGVREVAAMTKKKAATMDQKRL